MTLGFGTILLMLGFVTYQLGILATFRYESVANRLPKSLVTLLPPEVGGVMLQFVGGLMGILGFVVYMSGAVSSQERRIRELEALLASRREELLTPAKLCKFCGAEIENQAIFCAVCGKSQK
jgi:hypothetical protein